MVNFYSIFDDFWHLFEDHSSYISSKSEKLVFEQRYNTVATFSLPETSHFRIDFSSNLHLLFGTPSRTSLFQVYVSLLQTSEILGPL